MSPRRVPTKQELLQLQKLYRTDKKIGQALGNVSEQLVAYWRRKKGIGRSVFPKYSENDIRDLWERFGDDEKAGAELGITKQAFYRWRKKYSLMEKPAYLRLEQLEIRFFDERRLNRVGEREAPACTYLQKLAQFKTGARPPNVGDRLMLPADLAVTLCRRGICVHDFSKPIGKPPKPTETHFASLPELLSGGHFRPGQIIISDLAEAAALSVTSSYVLISAKPLPENLPHLTEVTILPVLRVDLAGALQARQNPFEAACRIAESLDGLREQRFAVEIVGAATDRLTLEERMAFLAYASFLTGRQITIEPDQAFFSYLQQFGVKDQPVPFTDKNASVLDEVAVPVARQRARFARIADRQFIREVAEFEARQLQRVRVGPLVGGTLDNIKEIAGALKNRGLRKGVELYLMPASQTVFAEALRRKFVQTIVEAGGKIGNLSPRPDLPPLNEDALELTTELDGGTASYLTSVPTAIECLIAGKVPRRIFEA